VKKFRAYFEEQRVMFFKNYKDFTKWLKGFKGKHTDKMAIEIETNPEFTYRTPKEVIDSFKKQ